MPLCVSRAGGSLPCRVPAAPAAGSELLKQRRVGSAVVLDEDAGAGQPQMGRH